MRISSSCSAYRMVRSAACDDIYLNNSQGYAYLKDITPIMFAANTSPKPVIASNGYFARKEDFEANFPIVLQAVSDYWIGQMKKSGKRLPVVLGMDDAPDAKHFQEMAVSFFKSKGLDVYTYQSRKHGSLPLPVGVLAHTARNFEQMGLEDKAVCGALMLTNGSRSMHTYGVRFINSNGGFFTYEAIKRLNELVDNPKNELMKGKTATENPFSYVHLPYPMHLGKLLNLHKLRRWIPTVYYSPMQGAAKDLFNNFSEPWFRWFFTVQDGYDKVFTVDRFISGRHLKDENLKPIKEDLHQSYRHNKIGIANNGDAGIVRILDETGNVIMPDVLSALTLCHKVENKKGYGVIIKTQDTSALIDEVARLYGLNVFEVPVGFQHVSDLMQKTKDNVLLATDGQGGLTQTGHVPLSDGVFGGFQTLEMLATTQTKLSKMIEQLYERLPVVITQSRYTITTKRPERLIERVRRLAASRSISIFNVDSRRSIKQLEYNERRFGVSQNEVKIYFKDGSWLLVRRRKESPDTFDLWVETLTEKKKINWRFLDRAESHHNLLVEKLVERLKHHVGNDQFDIAQVK